MMLTLTDADNGQPVDVRIADVQVVRTLSPKKTLIVFKGGALVEVRETRLRVQQLLRIYTGSETKDPLHVGASGE